MNLYDRQDLCASLSFVYRLIVASAPLLRFAIERSTGALRGYYIQHLAEETGHELMARADLERLGVADVPLSHRAAQIAGSQYYLIAHEHPALLLGYMHVLEVNALRPQAVDRLCSHHGVDLTMYRHHAEHDDAHTRDIEAAIAGLEPALQARVAWNERNVTHALQAVVADGFRND